MTNKKIPKDIEKLIWVLDNKFKGPFGLRVGFDSIVGLIPVIGDFLSLILSHYIIIRSVLLKVPFTILFRMLFNAYFDFFIGSLPLVGDIFDIFWKSNNKNKKLLSSYLSSPHKELLRSKVTVYFAFFLFIILFCFIAYIISMYLINLN